MTVAERVRLHRQRQREGKVGLRIWPDEASLVATLIAGNLLDPRLADNKAALAAATEEQLRLLERFPR